MKNIIKKIASITMAFTLFGTGTSVTKMISPESNTHIIANAGSKDYNKIGSIQLGNNEYAQGMAMYKNTIYFISEKQNSNCKLYKKSVNSNSTPTTININKSDRNKIGHGNDLCVAKCNGNICLFVVDGQNHGNILLKFKLDSKQENAELVAKYEFDMNISAVTLVNPDGAETDPLKFIFRNGSNIATVEIGRKEKNCAKSVTKVGTIKLIDELKNDSKKASQGICYYNGLLLVPYTAGNGYTNYIQVYGIDIYDKELEMNGNALCYIPLSNKNKTKFEIEGLDYSNNGTWFFNTNEKGYKSKIYNCNIIEYSLANAIADMLSKIITERGVQMADKIEFYE